MRWLTIHRLAHPDPKVREASIKRLAMRHSGDPKALNAVVAQLDDPHTRHAALVALPGFSGARTALEAVVRLLFYEQCPIMSAAILTTLHAMDSRWRQDEAALKLARFYAASMSFRPDVTVAAREQALVHFRDDPAVASAVVSAALRSLFNDSHLKYGQLDEWVETRRRCHDFIGLMVPQGPAFEKVRDAAIRSGAPTLNVIDALYAQRQGDEWLARAIKDVLPHLPLNPLMAGSYGSYNTLMLYEPLMRVLRKVRDSAAGASLSQDVDAIVLGVENALTVPTYADTWDANMGALVCIRSLLAYGRLSGQVTLPLGEWEQHWRRKGKSDYSYGERADLADEALGLIPDFTNLHLSLHRKSDTRGVLRGLLRAGAPASVAPVLKCALTTLPDEDVPLAFDALQALNPQWRQSEDVLAIVDAFVAGLSLTPEHEGARQINVLVWLFRYSVLGSELKRRAFPAVSASFRLFAQEYRGERSVWRDGVAAPSKKAVDRAIEALGFLGDSKALPELIAWDREMVRISKERLREETLSGHRRVLWPTLDAIGRIGGTSALDFLMDQYRQCSNKYGDDFSDDLKLRMVELGAPPELLVKPFALSPSKCEREIFDGVQTGKITIEGAPTTAAGFAVWKG
jgi:hypothetical protein